MLSVRQVYMRSFLSLVLVLRWTVFKTTSLPFDQTSTLILRVDPALPTSIKFVRQYKARKVIYDVEMYSVGASQAIRDAFGLFWRKKSGKRLPPELKGISFTNATTFPTRVRLRLLKELCRRHQLLNPNLSCYVTSYLARPELKIRDRRGMVTSLTYVQAVQQLPHHFTLSFLRDLYQYARTNLPEKEVIERFLILTPDLLLGTVPEQLSMSMDDPTSAQTPVIQPSNGQVPSANVQAGQGNHVSLAPPAPGPSSMSVPPPQLPASTANYGNGALHQSQNQNQFTPVSSSPTFQSQFPPANTVTFQSQISPANVATYASVASLPPVVGGEQASLFATSTPGPTPTPGLPTHRSDSPTYATLTTVQFSPPSLATGSFLPAAVVGGGETAPDDSLSKRNRHRFAQKSTPYPTQS